MKKIIKKIIQVFQNMIMMICSLMWKRDDSIVLVGAWFGKRFADNSRYLFQYLQENKEKLGLSKVIWVTKDNELCTILNKMGYESYLMNSKESIKFHKIAGWHIICNSSDINADINVKYSYGAKKVQLWHGVGMKAVGNASNLYARKGKLFGVCRRIYHILFGNFVAKGGWNNCAVLATSEMHAKLMSRVMDIPRKNLFISGYPRHCKCIKLMPNELEFIESIKKYKHIIIYLPTFRSNYTKYIHPLESDTLKKYLYDNNILWIEKQHPASNFDVTIFNSIDNFRLLDTEFDINVLMDYVDIVVTDYSSVSFDSINKGIKTILYTPDSDIFANEDVGFLYDYTSYFKGIISMNIKELIELINIAFNDSFFNDERNELYKKLRDEFFECKDANCEKIWKDINKYFNIK